MNLFYDKIKSKVPKDAKLIIYTAKILPEGLGSGISFIMKNGEQIQGENIIKKYDDFLGNSFEFGPRQLFEKQSFFKSRIKCIEIMIDPKINMYEIRRF